MPMRPQSAQALAPPAVAVEWCLPLVRPGGLVVLFVGPSADEAAAAATAAQQLSAEPAPAPAGPARAAEDRTDAAAFSAAAGPGRNVLLPE